MDDRAWDGHAEDDRIEADRIDADQIPDDQVLDDRIEDPRIRDELSPTSEVTSPEMTTVEATAFEATAFEATVPERDPDEGEDAGVLDEIEAELAEVEAALTRLDDGTYGSCEVCGASLDDEQLAQRPLARHCQDHLPLTLS